MAGGSRGFTLLELLVVLVIISTIVSFAVLSVGDGGQGRRTLQEGERLVALIEHGGDEALIQGRELGIHFTTNGYQFVTLNDGEWIPYAAKQSFRQRQLPNGIRLELSLDTLPVKLIAGQQPEVETVRLPDSVAPQLLLLSSGERTPFGITLFNGEVPAFEINGDVVGAVRWQRLGQVE